MLKEWYVGIPIPIHLRPLGKSRYVAIVDIDFQGSREPFHAPNAAETFAPRLTGSLYFECQRPREVGKRAELDMACSQIGGNEANILATFWLDPKLELQLSFTTTCFFFSSFSLPQISYKTKGLEPMDRVYCRCQVRQYLTQTMLQKGANIKTMKWLVSTGRWFQFWEAKKRTDSRE